MTWHAQADGIGGGSTKPADGGSTPLLGTMTEVEIAYVAGFFDGEGSATFLWVKQGRNQKRYPRIVAAIAQTDRRPLDWIKEWIGTGSVYKDKGDNVHHYMVTANGARKLLNAIRPYLRVKAERVDEVLDLDKKHITPR